MVPWNKQLWDKSLISLLTLSTMEEQKEKLEFIKNHIDSYPDFPKLGILFRWELWTYFNLYSLYYKWHTSGIWLDRFATVTTIIHSTGQHRYKLPCDFQGPVFSVEKSESIPCIARCNDWARVVAVDPKAWSYSSPGSKRLLTWATISTSFWYSIYSNKEKGKTPRRRNSSLFRTRIWHGEFQQRITVLSRFWLSIFMNSVYDPPVGCQSWFIYRHLR